MALATLLWFEQDIFADNYFILCLGECLANKRFWSASQENTTNPFAMTLVVWSSLVVVVLDVFYLVVSLFGMGEVIVWSQICMAMTPSKLQVSSWRWPPAGSAFLWEPALLEIFFRLSIVCG